MSEERRPLLLKSTKKKYVNPTTSPIGPSRRIPISFSSDNLRASPSINDIPSAEFDVNRIQASFSRYRYYNRLGMPRMPDHMVPTKFFYLIPLVSKNPGTQRSFITIFAIWNTMMGTSFLSMPWVLQQSGFLLGLFLMLMVATISFYMVYLVLKSTQSLPDDPERTLFNPDFTDACKFYLGRVGEVTAIVFSFIGLLGALIVYYVLLTDFLYSVVTYLYDYMSSNIPIAHPVTLYNRTIVDALCPSMAPIPTHNASLPVFLRHIQVTPTPTSNTTESTLFLRLWRKQATVPFWLLGVIFPLISIKSPTFFTKFNALGTVSVLYLAFLVLSKVILWGFHIDFSATEYPYVIPNAKVTFPIITGVSMMAFFIHNAIHSIVRNQAKPENNIRDVFIAYICVAATYVGIGILFYAAFPFPKDCLQQNFLANLTNNDVLTFVARVFLFFQMLTVFPLLMYILRSQFMYFFFKKFYPSWVHVLLLQLVLLTVCVLFAIYIPHIGSIIGFSGSLCGLVYVLALPCLVKMKMIRIASAGFAALPEEQRPQSWKMRASIIFHAFLILLGVLNFIGQFSPFF